MDAVPIGFRQVHDIGPTRDAGIVNRDVDTAELLHGFGNDPIDIVQIPHIGLHRHALALKSADGGGGFLGGFTIDIDRYDMCPSLGQGDCTGSADAAAGACHKGDFIAQQHRLVPFYEFSNTFSGRASISPRSTRST
ncbi:MAG: hypothetical protein WCI94_21905 [Rhodospirillales bacterium]